MSDHADSGTEGREEPFDMPGREADVCWALGCESAHPFLLGVFEPLAVRDGLPVTSVSPV